MQPSEMAAVEKENCQPLPERNFACPVYDFCLNLAVDRKWASFSCQNCQRRHDERDDWCLVQTRDVMRVRRLLAAAMRRKWPELGQSGFWMEVAPERLSRQLAKTASLDIKNDGRPTE